MWVRGRRGIKTVQKAMNRRKTSWTCFPAPLGPSMQGRGGAPAQGRGGGTAHRDVREEQHFCQGSW